MELTSQDKTINKLVLANEKLNFEISRLEDTMIQQYEFNQSLLRTVNHLKVQNQQANDRETLAKMKLFNHEMVRDFGEPMTEQIGLRESVKRMQSINESSKDDNEHEM